MHVVDPCIPPPPRLGMLEALSIAHNEPEPDLEVFALTGIIDARAEQLLHGLPDIIGSSRITFDFSGVKRINSMGIALLLRCFKRIKEQKEADLQVTNLNEVNTMLFRMTGVFQLVRAGHDCDPASI